MIMHDLAYRITVKLKSKQGFMFAEQLVSVIFIGLLSIAVATGLGVAMSAYGSITETTQTQALLNRAVQEVSDELAFSVERPANGSDQFASGSVNALVRFGSTNVSGGAQNGITLTGDGIQSGVTGGSAQTILLVPAMSDLVPTVRGVSYNSDTNTWTFTVDVVKAGATGAVVSSGVMTVARIGS